MSFLNTTSDVLGKGCAKGIMSVKLYYFGIEMDLVPAINTDSNKAGFVDLNTGIFYGHITNSREVRYGMI